MMTTLKDLGLLTLVMAGIGFGFGAGIAVVGVLVWMVVG